MYAKERLNPITYCMAAFVCYTYINRRKGNVAARRIALRLATTLKFVFLKPRRLIQYAAVPANPPKTKNPGKTTGDYSQFMRTK